MSSVSDVGGGGHRGCIQKFPEWVDNDNKYSLESNTLLVGKQHKVLWRQNSLDWLKK
jgi:hypothetical protein